MARFRRGWVEFEVSGERHFACWKISPCETIAPCAANSYCVWRAWCSLDGVSCLGSIGLLDSAIRSSCACAWELLDAV
jgi:hypothetical protein